MGRNQGLSEPQRRNELLALRDAANAVVASQRNGLPPEDREHLRGQLNRIYDAYVKRHGPIQRFKWSTPAEVTQDKRDEKLAKKIELWRKKNPDAARVPEELVEQWDQQAWETPNPYKLRPHIVTAICPANILRRVQVLRRRHRVISAMTQFAGADAVKLAG